MTMCASTRAPVLQCRDFPARAHAAATLPANTRALASARFRGHLVLLCNGSWCPYDAFIGADVRRLAGLVSNAKSKRNPHGPNKPQEDG